MDHFFTLAFAGVLALAIFVSAAVALLAMEKRIGYVKAFLLSLTLTIVLVLLRIPYPLLISGGICIVLFRFWPRVQPAKQ